MVTPAPCATPAPPPASPPAPGVRHPCATPAQPPAPPLRHPSCATTSPNLAPHAAPPPAFWCGSPSERLHQKRATRPVARDMTTRDAWSRTDRGGRERGPVTNRHATPHCHIFVMMVGCGWHTRGSKMGMRPSSCGFCPVLRLSRLWVRLAGRWAYAKRNFPGRASCGPFSKILMCGRCRREVYGPPSAVRPYYSASGCFRSHLMGVPVGGANSSRHAGHSLASSTSNHSVGLIGMPHHRYMTTSRVWCLMVGDGGCLFMCVIFSWING